MFCERQVRTGVKGACCRCASCTLSGGFQDKGDAVSYGF